MDLGPDMFVDCVENLLEPNLLVQKRRVSFAAPTGPSIPVKYICAKRSRLVRLYVHISLLWGCFISHHFMIKVLFDVDIGLLALKRARTKTFCVKCCSSFQLSLQHSSVYRC